MELLRGVGNNHPIIDLDRANMTTRLLMETKMKIKIKDGIQVYGVTDKDITDVIIPDGVTTIERDAFKNCRKLKSIILPSSLREIQGYAFSDCTSLQSITLPEGFR